MDQDRDLWHKATEAPGQVTEVEKRRILGYVDRDTQVASAFKVSELTPEQLENKALTNPKTLTKAKCHLLQRGYHICDHYEMMASIDSKLAWTSDDTMAELDACAALHTPHIEEVMDAVSRRTNFFADEKAKVSKATIAKAAENIDEPCAWIRRLTPSVATLEETPHWGFIGFRDAATECSKEVWETLMKRFGKYVTLNCLKYLTGGAAIDSTS